MQPADHRASTDFARVSNDRSAETDGAPCNENDADVSRMSADASGRALSDKQRLAIEMLVAGLGPHVLVAELQISRSTFWRWRREPAFRNAFEEAVARRGDDLIRASRHVLRHALLVVDNVMLGDAADARTALAVLRTRKLWQLADPVGNAVAREGDTVGQTPARPAEDVPR